MKLLALVESERGAATRYRVLQFVDALRAASIKTEVAAVPSERAAKLALWERVSEADVVLVQRRLLSPFDAVRLRRRARRLVFDFDDALPYRDSQGGAGRSVSRHVKFRAITSRADLVLAGNEYLADLAGRFASSVRVVPTAVPTDRFRPCDPAPPWTLGWIGSRSTLPYLEAIVPALDDLAASDDRFRLRVVSDAFPRARRIEIERVPWSEADEPIEIARFGIGLSPLPDDAWTRGKCGLRALLYFASGVPVIASPVGVQARLVLDGVTGLRASRAIDFTRAVHRYVDDGTLRRSCASAARSRAEEQYSVERIAPVLVDALRSLG